MLLINPIGDNADPFAVITTSSITLFGVHESAPHASTIKLGQMRMNLTADSHDGFPVDAVIWLACSLKYHGPRWISQLNSGLSEIGPTVNALRPPG
jgi:hypothetical protein